LPTTGPCGFIADLRRCCVSYRQVCAVRLTEALHPGSQHPVEEDSGQQRLVLPA